MNDDQLNPQETPVLLPTSTRGFTVRAWGKRGTTRRTTFRTMCTSSGPRRIRWARGSGRTRWRTPWGKSQTSASSRWVSQSVQKYSYLFLMCTVQDRRNKEWGFFLHIFVNAAVCGYNMFYWVSPWPTQGWVMEKSFFKMWTLCHFHSLSWQNIEFRISTSFSKSNLGLFQCHRKWFLRIKKL